MAFFMTWHWLEDDGTHDVYAMRLEARIDLWLWRAAYLREREAAEELRLRERAVDLDAKLAETAQNLKLAEERIKDLGYDMMDMAARMED